MKKCVILLTIFAAFSVAGCKSNEEKANELIRAELFKSLYDFNSYEPIETTIIPAKNTAINDSTCYARALVTHLIFCEMLEYLSNALKAADKAEIWGPPTYWSSSRSDRKYYQYKKEMNDNIKSFEALGEIYNKHVDTLKNLKFNLDTTRIIGWEVTHKYRCKTKGGYSDIANDRYIMNLDFTKIIFRIDLDSEEYKTAITAFENIDKGTVIDEKILEKL